jgi:ribosome modulation factor
MPDRLKKAEQMGYNAGAVGYYVRTAVLEDLRPAYQAGWRRGLADRPPEWLPVKVLLDWFDEALKLSDPRPSAAECH